MKNVLEMTNVSLIPASIKSRITSYERNVKLKRLVWIYIYVVKIDISHFLSEWLGCRASCHFYKLYCNHGIRIRLAIPSHHTWFRHRRQHDDVIKWKHFPRYWPFVKFTGHRWIPRTKASDTEFGVFFDLCMDKRLSKQWWAWWFETPSRPLWHCN